MNNSERRNMHRALIGLASWLAVACMAAESPSKVRVLIVTGDDVSPAHNWAEVAATTRQILESSGKFEVKVCEDAGIFDSASSLSRYDLVYFTMYNARTPTISDQAKENLLNYVKSGKGFVVAHLASASFKEWNEFRNLCGRVWVMGTSGHGPRSVFKARVVKKDHPITRGISDFDVDDELYAKLQGDAPINVLVEADSDWSKKTEPLVFTLEYGKGRVFHHTFGHDGKALMTPAVKLIIQRGSEWAATGNVTQ
ncbi:MAG: ThuA domain-containing protein [Verrucomicrobiae bacterium]|nr:ThuA domain-containing protein [Verrucomicrobiae bacterium]